MINKNRIIILFADLSILIGLIYLISLHDEAYANKDGAPITYYLLFAVFLVGFCSLGLLFLVYDWIRIRFEQALQFSTKYGLTGLICLGLLVGILLIRQIEIWHFHGTIYLSISAALVLVALILYLYSNSLNPQKLVDNFAHAIRGVGSLFNKVVSLIKVSWRTQPIPWTIALVIIAVVAISEYRLFSFPLLCDEASTIELFGNSIYRAVTDYTYPNNHLLNSALVFVSTSLFGPSEFAIRLPAYLASLAGLISVFFLANNIFGLETGLASLALYATSGWIHFYFFQSRGYAYLSVFTCLSIWFLFKTLKSPSNRLTWGIYVTCLAILYAILPTTIYFWLSLSVFGLFVRLLSKFIHLEDEAGWFRQFIIHQALILAYAGLIYLNPLFSRFRNGQLFSPLAQILPKSFDLLANEILTDIGLWITRSDLYSIKGMFFLAAIVIIITSSLIWLMKRRLLLLLFVTTTLFPILILWVQGKLGLSLPYSRNFIYLVPLVYIWIAAGLVDILRTLYEVIPDKIILPTLIPITVLATIILVSASFISQIPPVYQSLRAYREEWPVIEIATYLKQINAPKEAIVAGICQEYMLQYYLPENWRVFKAAEVMGSTIHEYSSAYIIPVGIAGLVDYTAQDFLEKACEGLSSPKLINQFGKQAIYYCQKK